jgi:hypothetical protein
VVDRLHCEFGGRKGKEREKKASWFLVNSFYTSLLNSDKRVLSE